MNGVDLANPHLAAGSVPLPVVEQEVGIVYA